MKQQNTSLRTFLAVGLSQPATASKQKSRLARRIQERMDSKTKSTSPRALRLARRIQERAGLR